MVVRLFAAGLSAVMLIAGAQVASAADLGSYEPDGYSPYDDPRYADIYRDPKPHPYPPYGAPRPHAPEPYYEDHRRREHSEYLEPLPHPPSFGDYRPRRAQLAPGCLPRGAIRHELLRDGWTDLDDFEIREDFVLLTARRPNGTLYRLKVDRCRGDVEHAKRLDERGNAFAWRRRGAYPTY